MDSPIRLESQMRVMGGEGYLKYIQNILNSSQKSRKSFNDYELVLHDDFGDFLNSFESTQTRHNLTRIIAGYAWKWVSRDDENSYDIEIDGYKVRWNSILNNWVGKGVDNEEIAHEAGCIHSIQGYDLSYAYVIIGNDLALDYSGNITSNKNSYFDITGKNSASKDELDQYIKNIYYVLLTRGIYGTHIYVQNRALRDYFARYVDIK